jgi:hypothetical protein
MSKTHLFGVNRSVTSLAGESRALRLPSAPQFPRLNQRISRPVTVCAPAGVLPEMTTDVINVAAGYAVENVKRDRNEPRSWVRFGWGHLVARMLGYSHRAARP